MNSLDKSKIHCDGSHCHLIALVKKIQVAYDVLSMQKQELKDPNFVNGKFIKYNLLFDN